MYAYQLAYKTDMFVARKPIYREQEALITGQKVKKAMFFSFKW